MLASSTFHRCKSIHSTCMCCIPGILSVKSNWQLAFQLPATTWKFWPPWSDWQPQFRTPVDVCILHLAKSWVNYLCDRLSKVGKWVSVPVLYLHKPCGHNYSNSIEPKIQGGASESIRHKVNFLIEICTDVQYGTHSVDLRVWLPGITYGYLQLYIEVKSSAPLWGASCYTCLRPQSCNCHHLRQTTSQQKSLYIVVTWINWLWRPEASATNTNIRVVRHLKVLVLKRGPGWMHI